MNRTMLGKVLAPLVAMVVGCGRPESVCPPRTGGAIEVRGAFAAEVPARITAPQKPGITVLTMVDDSGSMNGFAMSLPQANGWVSKGLSRMGSYGFELRTNRCLFSRRRGIDCSSTGAPAFAGDTNLDEAVANAEQFDLTVILTDGVAATGSSSTPKCASGVDASCVGTSLGDFVLRGSRERGVWIVPVILAYNGRLFTERRVSSASFSGADVSSTIDGAVISNAQNLASGELVFDYSGPRALLLVVLAKNVNAGRAFVAGLRDTSGLEGVEWNRRAALGAAMGPYEVFPGVVSPFNWTAISESEDMANVSHSAELDGKAQQLRFRFGGNDPAPGKWVVRGGEISLPATASISLRNVLDLTPAGSNSSGAPVAITLGETGPILEVSGGCGSAPADCTHPSTVSVFAQRSVSVGAFSDLSTLRSELEPQKSFGLADVVQSFYQRMGPMEPLELSKLTLCAEASK